MADSNTGQSRDVAVVYHYFAHYRGPVIRALCQNSDHGLTYSLFSDRNSNIPSLETVDNSLAGIPVSSGGLRWRFVRNVWLGGPFLWQRGVCSLAVEDHFDTIIYLGNMYFISTWLSSMIARLRGKRVLFWTHGLLQPEQGPKKLLRHTFYRLAHGLLLYGQRARAILQEQGFPAEQLYVVYNSLDFERQRSLMQSFTKDAAARIRRDLFNQPDWPVIVAAGRLTESKKLHILLEAIDDLNENRSINLLIIGDGPELDNLKTLAIELGIEDRTHFFGACHDEEILAPLIMSSSLCVIPGSIGLTAIHMLGYGIPVITHNNADHQKPEWEAIIPGINGGLFQENDREDLVRTISEWLDRLDTIGTPNHMFREIIQTKYNPIQQVRLINAAVRGDFPPDLTEKDK